MEFQVNKRPIFEGLQINIFLKLLLKSQFHLQTGRTKWDSFKVPEFTCHLRNVKVKLESLGIRLECSDSSEHDPHHPQQIAASRCHALSLTLNHRFSFINM